VLPEAANDLQRLPVGDAEVAAEEPAAGGESHLEEGSGAGKRSAGMPRRRTGSGDSEVHTPRWLAYATPGKSAPWSNRSRMTWKWRCGGQSPLTGEAPTRAMR